MAGTIDVYAELVANVRETTVEERLRAALNVELGALHEGLDMSSAAVTARIVDACQMSALCLALGQSVPLASRE